MCVWTCTVEVGGHLPTALLPQTSLNEVNRCVRESTGWSACSVSCGVGVSVKITNDNEDCVTVHERRLCVVRPCGVDDSNVVRYTHLISIVIILLVQKPKMQQCKLKTWTLNKTHQAQTSSYGGL